MSLAALRWLADQDAAFVMLDRDGSVLLATGPVGPRDARLRRAQALAHQTGLAVSIARELIGRKLTQQARIARGLFRQPDDRRHDQRQPGTLLQSVETVRELRHVEAQAALAYWSLMRTVPVEFPRSDLARVPDHWRVFGTRHSPLTNSPRLSVNPPNAMLNYLYALLESESRLAAAALGLDPGLAFLHADTSSRDSLACDLMEPLRPEVDAYVLNWLRREPLRREWFFEQRNGNCRLMASFASHLAETSSTWAQRVAPVAEWVARSSLSLVQSVTSLGTADALDAATPSRGQGRTATGTRATGRATASLPFVWRRTPPRSALRRMRLGEFGRTAEQDCGAASSRRKTASCYESSARQRGNRVETFRSAGVAHRAGLSGTDSASTRFRERGTRGRCTRRVEAVCGRHSRWASSSASPALAGAS